MNNNYFFEDNLKDLLNSRATEDDGSSETDELQDTLKDLKSKTDDVKDKIGTVDKYTKNHYLNRPSIVTRSKNSVIQFPIYVSSSLRVTEAQIISKLFERVYTSFVQTALAQNPYLNEDEVNGMKFLKRFHTNLTEAADILREEYYNKYFEAIDDLDQIIADSVFYTSQISENVSVEFKLVKDENRDLLMENARLLNEPLTGFDYLIEASESDTTTTKDTKKNVQAVDLSDKDLRNMALNMLEDEQDIEPELRRILDMNNAEIKKDLEEENDYLKMTEVEKQNVLAETIGERDKLKEALNDRVDKLKKDIKEKKVKNVEYKNGRYFRKSTTVSETTKTSTMPKKAEKSLPVQTPAILKEADIKKINGMLPYIIQASFKVKTKNGQSDEVRFLIGVKSVMHLIQVKDLSEDIDDIVNGNNKNLRKVKYKTGEIGLLDYIFNIKQIKSDAAKQIKGGKRWINTLKRLAEFRKTNGSFLKAPMSAIAKGDVPVPNGTLILTSSDVSLILNQTGIDLNKVSAAKRLAANLFLIAIAIVDSTSGSMKILFPDRDTDWDFQSLASIDAEVSKADDSRIMKELNRMINR
jgi:hypothetical protein